MASSQPANGELPKKVTFRFCRECSNMLYPKEDAETRTLTFACRTCQFSESAVTTCIYRNELGNTVGETAGITQDVGSDPTVGIPDFCTMCGQEISCEICGEPCEEGFYLEVDDEDLPEETLPDRDAELTESSMHSSECGNS